MWEGTIVSLPKQAGNTESLFWTSNIQITTDWIIQNWCTLHLVTISAHHGYDGWWHQHDWEEFLK